MAPDDLVAGDIALIVEIGTVRTVLKALQAGGNRWWLASDPADAAENGQMIVGFGEQLGSDRLNAVYFRIPVLDSETAELPDGVFLLIAPALIDSIEPGRSMQPDRRTMDCVGDFERFYFPLKSALAQLLAAGGFHSSGPPHAE